MYLKNTRNTYKCASNTNILALKSLSNSQKQKRIKKKKTTKKFDTLATFMI